MRDLFVILMGALALVLGMAAVIFTLLNILVGDLP